MKFSIILIFLFLSLSALCQRRQVTGHIKNRNTPLEFKYFTVLLKKGDTTLTGAMPDSLGNFKLKKSIEDGVYSLVIKQLGYRDDILDSLTISSDTTLNIVYPPICKYIYSKGQKVKCIYEHSDHIIPIVYGLPSKKTMNDAKKGLLYLGGCLVSDCDPHYYCTIHKIEL